MIASQLIVILCLAPLSEGALAAPTVPEDPAGHVSTGPPPAALAATANLDGLEYLSATGIFGRPVHVLSDKKVQLKYFATTGDIHDATVAQGSIVESTSYWPTSAAVLDPTHIAVAGMGLGQGRDHTVIEIWRIRTPLLVWSLNPSTGQNEANIENLGVLSKTQIYSEATPGRDIVRGMVRMRGVEDAMLVHFYDSGDLYRLEYGEAIAPTEPPPDPLYPLTKLLRATAGSDVPVFPALGNKDMLWISGATHTQQGAVYAIWAGFDTQMELGASTPLPIALYDHDMDGNLDEWTQPTVAENQSDGMLNESLYTEKFLRTSW